MENDKLVRLSDVIETIENQCSDGNMWGNENLTLIDARKTIDELSDIPAVDAVPVVHGHWIYKWNPYFKVELPYCSVCEKASPSISKTDYCPHCGAVMDEVTES